MTTPEVSVVVPYYEAQRQLDRLLAALDVQELPADRFEVVVADDGSAVPPAVGRHAYRARVVRQEDDGFRAAAARNLGASVATGRVLCFLDQDCVPEPGYLRRVLEAAAPWSLVVGHRRHARLEGWDGPRVRDWLLGGCAPDRLPEPGWLAEGYARTHDLREPDERAYQLVIGAVVSLTRDLFVALGGFDGEIREYGGEDWDLGHRAWVAGAELRFLEDAVAWHDGPDFAGREVDHATTKNRETLALARRIPDPDVRGTGLVWAVPEVVVVLDPADAQPAIVVAAVESLLLGSDAGVWMPDGAVVHAVMAHVEDPRVHVGDPPDDVLAQARYLVHCGPVVLCGRTLKSLTRLAPVDTPGFRLSSMRDVNRARRGYAPPPAGGLPPGTLTPLGPGNLLEQHWRDRSAG